MIPNSGYVNGALYIHKDTTTDIEVNFQTPVGYDLADDFIFEGGMRKYNRYEVWEGVATKTSPDVTFNWQVNQNTGKVNAYITATDSKALTPGKYTFSLQVTDKKTNNKQNIMVGWAYVIEDAGGYNAA